MLRWERWGEEYARRGRHRGDNTPIEQGTELYDAALGLAPGDTVTFSGTLKSGSAGNDTCYYTSNLTETMSIDSPDYIITFSELMKVE